MIGILHRYVTRKRRLRAAVEARQEAREAYDDAKARGDTRAVSAAALRLQRCTADVLELEGGW
jgi:hypothetical protein